MQSQATTVAQYLAELPADRRAAIEAVRAVILQNLDPDYEESMQYGMIGYGVPHRVYPAGYHCDPTKPVPFAAIASQKNHMAVYLMTVYGEGTPGESWFRNRWKQSGKKLDMGKCCIRFKKLDDLALDVIGEAIRRVPVAQYIKRYEEAIPRTARRKASGRTRKAVLARKSAAVDHTAGKVKRASRSRGLRSKS